MKDSLLAFIRSNNSQPIHSCTKINAWIDDENAASRGCIVPCSAHGACRVLPTCPTGPQSTAAVNPSSGLTS